MTKKFTELTAMTTAVTGDVLPIVDDPGGTPLTQKITAGNLASSIRTLQADTHTGADVAVVADDNVIGGIPVVHRIQVASGADGDADVTLTHKTRVIDAWAVLKGAGTAGCTITVKNGATAISDAMDVSAGGDKDVFRVGEIDDAQHEIAAAGTLRISKASTGGDFPGAEVYVMGLRVA